MPFYAVLLFYLIFLDITGKGLASLLINMISLGAELTIGIIGWKLYQSIYIFYQAIFWVNLITGGFIIFYVLIFVRKYFEKNYKPVR